MNQKCFSCGVEKNLDIGEVSLWAEEDGLTDELMSPLHVIECCSSEPNKDTKIWKAAIVCNECFHRLQPDMWISENCWIELSPIIPFDKLPKFDYNERQRWDPETYKFPEIDNSTK